MNFDLLKKLIAALWFLTAVCFSTARAEIESVDLKVALVDVATVMEKSNEWVTFQRESRQRREEAEDVLREYQSRLSVLEMEYENLPPGTDRTAQKRREMEDLVEEFQQRQDELSREFREYMMANLRQLYSNLKEIIAIYSQEHGLDLVLKKQEVTPAASDAEDISAFETSAVLYAAPRLDITTEIIDMLNERYESESE